MTIFQTYLKQKEWVNAWLYITDRGDVDHSPSKYNNIAYNNQILTHDYLSTVIKISQVSDTESPESVPYHTHSNKPESLTVTVANNQFLHKSHI